jgi:NAD-dependent dihydropyrimidine dehydrogenase PreA subunit
MTQSNADETARRLKFVAIPAIFGLVAAGRWFNLSVVEHATPGYSLEWAAVYGVLAGFIGYHLAGLFLAHGRLQITVAWASNLALYLLAVVVCNSIIDVAHFDNATVIAAAEGGVGLFLGLMSIVVDVLSRRGEVFVRASDRTLPMKYLRRRPLLTVFETLFRLLPRPEPVGLYAIGNPDEKSMVLVTGNYELTVRRVAQSLRGVDCWLLVCDSRGVNVWCSSLADHFNSDRIVEAIDRARLSDVVTHRKLILPQLCAGNVSQPVIHERTGFSSRFGPVRIEDFQTHLADPTNTAVRHVTFPAGVRLEMATGTILLPAILTVLVFNAIDPRMLLVVLPSFYAVSLLNALIFPHRPIPSVRWWSLVYGALVFGVAWAIGTFVLGVPSLWHAIAIGVGALYFVNEFEGWSPLVKFSVSGAYTHAEIEVIFDKCTGCGTCVEVCPKGVYTVVSGTSTVVDLDACCSCRSCFVQCPEDAIRHSADRK